MAPHLAPHHPLSLVAIGHRTQVRARRPGYYEESGSRAPAELAVTAGLPGSPGLYPPGIRTAMSSRPAQPRQRHHSLGVVDGQRPAGGTGMVGGRRPGGVLALVQLGEYGVLPFVT